MAWNSVTDQDILSLQKVDETLLRLLLNSHSKAPIEFLYLESGTILITFIMSSRRMNYLQTTTEGEAVAEDTQQHLLVCSKLKNEFQSEELAKGQIVYEVFDEVNKQTEAVVLFSKLMEARERVLQDRENQPLVLCGYCFYCSCLY